MEQVDVWEWLPWWLHPDIISPVSILFTLVATAVIAIATVVNVWVSGRMAKAAKDSSDAAKQSADTAEAILEASHRPYLAVTRVNPMVLVGTEEQKDVDQITVTTKNYGNVPLELSDVDIQVLALAQGDKNRWTASAEPCGESVVLPDGDTRFKCLLKGFGLHQAYTSGEVEITVDVNILYQSVATKKQYRFVSKHHWQKGAFESFSTIETRMD